jgi:hypothetical protein
LAPDDSFESILRPFIDQSASMREGQFQSRNARRTKKKGGAMNAPPLKGSDTSVSSPKRQTAEAVRHHTLANVRESQA